MTFNLNFDPKLLRQAVDALIQLAADYRAVHRTDIEFDKQMQERQQQGATKGGIFYQSDKRLYEDEQRERQRKEAETHIGV